MYSILLSAAAAVAVLLVLLLGFQLSWWLSLMAGMVVFTAVFVIASRIIM
jgi:hypothetical protein